MTRPDGSRRGAQGPSVRALPERSTMPRATSGLLQASSARVRCRSSMGAIVASARDRGELQPTRAREPRTTRPAQPAVDPIVAVKSDRCVTARGALRGALTAADTSIPRQSSRLRRIASPVSSLSPGLAPVDVGERKLLGAPFVTFAPSSAAVGDAGPLSRMSAPATMSAGRSTARLTPARPALALPLPSSEKRQRGVGSTAAAVTGGTG